MTINHAVRALFASLAFACLLESEARSQCPVNDSFEPNDTCATATPLTSGAYDATILGWGESDYYSLLIPAGGGLQFDSTSDDWGAVADLGYTLYSGTDCSGGILAFVQAGFAYAQLHWENTTGADLPVTLRVRVGPTHPGVQCVNYTLNIAVVSPACEAASGDDGFEVNNNCAQAAIISDGLWSDLYISYFSPGHDYDFYKLAVHPGQTLAVDLLFDHAAADLDLLIHAGLKQCEGQATAPSGETYVAAGQSMTDGESAVWVNDTGLTWSVFIRVRLDEVPRDGCGLYDMQITRFDTGIGTSFCFGDGSASGAVCPCGNPSSSNAGCANSQGHGAILTAAGTTNVANDDLSFSVIHAAPNQPFMLLQGATSIAVPFKDGILCTGNPTRRMEVVFLDAAGFGTTVESVVTNGAIAPGQTRYYQAWYRDPLTPAPCTGRSNLTQALELAWN